MTRGLRGVYLRRGLLNPLRHGYYSIQLLSHKVLRRLMVIPLLGLLVGCALDPGIGWRLAGLVQALGYAAGGVGLLLRSRGLRSGPLTIPAFFVMVNVASAHAVWNVVRGRRIDRWQPRRIDLPDAAASAGAGIGGPPDRAAGGGP
jgi:hypothetical protein